MKDLIISALDEAYKKVLGQVPETKSRTEFVSIEDVDPLDLNNFMRANGIPSGCYFSADEDSEAGLSWSVEVPTTEKEKLSFIKNRFNNNAAWHFVFLSLTGNGYKKVGYDTNYLKQFKGTTVYDMYINKELDRLVEYYSLPFIKTN